MRILAYFSLLILCSCISTSNEPQNNNSVLVDDAVYVVHDSFAIGDVRRYGVFPDKPINAEAMTQLYQIADLGITILFPQGFYDTDLIIKGKSRLNFKFHDASFSGQIQIIENENQPSQHIILKGKLTTYSKFFTRKSHNIAIDTLIIGTDTLKNKFGKRSLGCSIYAGTKNMHIKKLVVEDLGSGDDYYRFSLAAIQLHGWNNNPQNITIDEAIVEKSDRHGVYITGKNHQINNLAIKQVGLGSITNHNGLEDADAHEIALVSSLWINKCHDSRFTNVIIDCAGSKPQFTVNFDEGIASEPTIIDYLTIKNNTSSIQLLPNDLTNVVVRHFKETK